MVSILLLYLNFPPLRSTIQWFPIYSCMQNSSPPALHQTMVSILLLYLHFPPRAPPINALHEASLFKLPAPALHQTMLSMKLLYLNFPPPALHQTMLSMNLLYFNFPPPCAPPYDGLHFYSLFKLPPLRSTIHWFPIYSFI